MLNKLFLASDNMGRTLVNLATNFPNLEIFKIILDLAKKTLSTEDIKMYSGHR
jgi:hypothetical protein